jgi:hypothetical protein
MTKVYFRKGAFDFDALIVKFGGDKSKPENIFTATAIKVPDFTYTVMEKEDAGGGWYYENKVAVEYRVNNAYIIMRNNEIIGWMRPYEWETKSDLFLLDWKLTNQQIKDFAKKITQPQ